MKTSFKVLSSVAAFVLAAGLAVSCGPEEVAEIPVSSVSVSPPSLNMVIGDMAVLSATVSPSDATDKKVTWTSSDQGVATVSEGRVTAVAEGSATITATAGGKSATCSVTVGKGYIPVESVELDRTSTINLREGESYTITATVKPEDASNPDVYWQSSNPDAVTVEDGVVTAVADGASWITATADGKSARVLVAVNSFVAVESVELSFKQLTLVEGDSYTLYATVYPEDATDPSITWYSSKPDVVTVEDGVVTAIAKGTANVVANAGDVYATCVVIVEKKPAAVEGVTLDRSELLMSEGTTFTLTATVTPQNAGNMNVIWESSDTGVAAVSESGTVTAVRAGTATVTVRTEDGNKTASCSVTVFPFDYEKEHAALVALYNATGGDNWNNKQNWCSERPHGEWYGVTADERGQVTEIRIGMNNMTGHLPAEVFSLPGLQYLDLSNNSIAGIIPEEIGDAISLSALFLQCNSLTGRIPESLYELKKLSFISLWSNKISGELSEKLWTMPELRDIDLSNNLITGQLTPAVRNATKLQRLSIASNSLKGTIPREITELKDLWIFKLGNTALYNGGITEAQNDISGTIPEDLDKLQKLEIFDVPNNNLEGNVPACFSRMPKLRTLVLYGNRLSGEIPSEVVESANWEIWAPDKNIMPQQKDYVLSFGHYESKDFSDDGKVVRLQTHEKGNGISLVITGDCFTDRDIAAGQFDKTARQTMEDFFAVEPFATFRNLFDVYAVIAVSKTNYSDYGTALGALYGEGAAIYCDEAKVKQYSSKAVSNLDETLTIVIVNKNISSGTAYMPNPTIDTDYGSGFSYACFGLESDEAARRVLINHEANGHGFTKLQDEYILTRMGAYPEELKEYIKKNYFARGYYANVDFESDPAKVKWARFLSDERYKYDGLGVFEGGMTYEYGVWRPSSASIMFHQNPTGEGSRFNAPSRAAAYIRIHKLAYGDSWQFDYEEFVKYDAINRKTSDAYKTKRRRSK